MLKTPWITGVATALSLMACYGTLTAIAVLGAFGMAVTVNETLWSGAIVAFALAALGGLVASFLRHHRIWPVLVGGLGAAILGYAFYVHYTHLTEFGGFALLAFATLWDWRLLRKCRSVESTTRHNRN